MRRMPQSLVSNIYRPVIAHLQTIEMASGQPPLMLHPLHQDTRCNAEARGGVLHLLFGAQPLELQGRSRRNQLIRGETIGFGLLLIIHTIEAIHKRGLLAMFVDVASLMEQREPKVIVGFVAQAQGDQGPIGAEPLGGPTHTAAWWGWHEHHRHTGGTGQGLQLLHKHRGIRFAAEGTNRLQRRPKGHGFIGSAGNRGRLHFGTAQPAGQGALLRRKALGAAIDGQRLAVALPPGVDRRHREELQARRHLLAS